MTLLAALLLLMGWDGAGNEAKRAWLKNVVVYQIYPGSFADGIGDLKGITAKVQHLAKVDVTVIWRSPHSDLPNVVNGPGIRDYRKVIDEFRNNG